MPDLDALLDKARPRSSESQPCWRRRIDGRSLAFVESVERLRKAGEDFTDTGIARVLSDDLGFRIKRARIGAHYRGECSCPR